MPGTRFLPTSLPAPAVLSLSRSQAAPRPQDKEGVQRPPCFFSLCTSNRPIHCRILNPFLKHVFLWILHYLINVCVQHFGQFCQLLLLPTVLDQPVINPILSFWILTDTDQQSCEKLDIFDYFLKFTLPVYLATFNDKWIQKKHEIPIG